jgi:K(+)-stimulated pyrophosphate-energized sodium pump
VPLLPAGGWLAVTAPAALYAKPAATVRATAPAQRPSASLSALSSDARSESPR